MCAHIFCSGICELHFTTLASEPEFLFARFIGIRECRPRLKQLHILCVYRSAARSRRFTFIFVVCLFLPSGICNHFYCVHTFQPCAKNAETMLLVFLVQKKIEWIQSIRKSKPKRRAKETEKRSIENHVANGKKDTHTISRIGPNRKSNTHSPQRWKEKSEEQQQNTKKSKNGQQQIHSAFRYRYLCRSWTMNVKESRRRRRKNCILLVSAASVDS